MHRLAKSLIRQRTGLKWVSAVAQKQSNFSEADPYKVLSVPQNVNRDELRDTFFQLSRTHHPSVTGDTEAYDKIVAAYEAAVQQTDQSSPIEPWDGISGMTYAQAWEGKDYWRKKWESHWSGRLAHMYKHKDEMVELESNMNWRAVQYCQAQDWFRMASPIMDEATRQEWSLAIESWRGMILWAQANKRNYRRYYISNTNAPAHMNQVYKDHQFWKKFENMEWAEWDAFFSSAESWINKNEAAVRARHNTTGPLAVKFNYLMKDRLTFSQQSASEKLEIREAEGDLFFKKWVFRELARIGRQVARLLERAVRAAFPVFLIALVVLWYYDLKPLFTIVDIPVSDPTRAVQLSSKRVEAGEWATSFTK